MSKRLSFEVFEAGIDWLTTTSTDKRTSWMLLHRAAAIEREEERRGFFKKAWRQSGYVGWCCGRIQHGERGDGAMVRLSSDLAQEYWWDCYQITERCSRMDWQITGRPNCDVNRFLKTIRGRVRKHYESHNRPPRQTTISDAGGGFTFYLGSRSSDCYFRAYNKAVESGDDYYAGSARLELEMKGDATKHGIAYVLSGSSVSRQVCDGVKGFAAVHGISGIFTTENPPLLCKGRSAATDVIKTLGWLTESVRPSVLRLIDLGHSASVMEALGISSLVKPQSEV